MVAIGSEWLKRKASRMHGRRGYIQTEGRGCRIMRTDELVEAF